MAYVDEVLADEPYVFWRMGGASSPVADAGGGISLTVAGGTFGGGGAYSGASSVAFDGVNDGAGAALVLGDATVITIETFIKWAAYGDDDALLCEFNSRYFENPGSFIIDPNNGNGGGEADTGFVGFSNGAGSSRWTFPRSAMTAAEWHHLAVVLDRTADTAKMYVDGSAVTLTRAETGSTPSTFANDDLSLMSRGVTSLFAAGELSEFAIYKSELGADRVAVHASFFAPPTVVLGARHSGGSGNTSGAASLGAGAGGLLAQSANALFGTPSNADRIAGLTDYRCVYIRNAGAVTATDVRVWVQAPSAATDVDEAIGEDTSNPAQTIAAATTAPAGVSFSAPSNYAGGLTLGDLDTDEVVPVWIRRELDADAAVGTRTITLGVSYDGAASSTLITVSYTIVVPVVLYVESDSVDSSDTWTRSQAGDDDTKPFKTVQAAALLALSGDTVRVRPSVMLTANPADPIDQNVYVGLHHLRTSDGSDVIPAALNGAGEPIIVEGEIIGGIRPKLRLFDARGLDNWQLKNVQRGYDRDSGDDHNTAGTLHDCTSIKFVNVIDTGGGYYCIGCHDVIEWENCTTYSPWGGSGGFMDGAGFHVLAIDTATGAFTDVTYRYTNHWFEQIEGEDAIQTSFPDMDHGVLEVLGGTFKDITQATTPGAPHTDCIQSQGGMRHTLVGVRFIGCASPFIASDFANARVEIMGCLVDGPGNGFHGQGMAEFFVVHNTIRTPGFSIAVGDRTNQSFPDFVQKLTIANNIAGDIDIAAGAVIDAASVVQGNIFTRQPGLELAWGTNLAGLPEFGTSARLTSAGLTSAYELSNTPVDSPGIGQGIDLSGLLDGTLLGYVADDLLGRAFATPRDVGALQSDPAVEVTPAPRPPYVTALSPAPNSVCELDVSLTAELLPVPGQTIEASTVTTDTAFVIDAATSVELPAVASISAPGEDRFQLLTLDFKAVLSPEAEGELWPRVLYRATLTGIEDTEGSAIVPTVWEFRAGGPSGPAITGADEGVDTNASFTIGGAPWSVGATVRVYPREALPVGAAGPSGPQVTSAVVGAASSATFTGLTEGIRYVAFAEGRAVQFMVPSPRRARVVRW